LQEIQVLASQYCAHLGEHHCSASNSVAVANGLFCLGPYIEAHPLRQFMQVFSRILSGVALALLTTSTYANDIQIVPVTHPDGTPSQPEVYLSGEITDATVDQLSALIRERRLNSSIVYLNSDGGDPQ